ncbi:MAG: hypothetical protein H6672_07495 [Anaerolineaceae bacterium]|nr:hypothetical protein [Anaerolineaceae bacterium]
MDGYSQHLAALRRIHGRLAGSEIVWALTGSLSFALQGVPVEPHDIDLQTNAAGAYAIERHLADYVTRPVAFSAAETVRSHFGRLRVGGVEVDIIGDIEKRLPDGSWDAPPDIAHWRRWITATGIRLPVLALEYEVEAYRKLGRLEQAQLVKDFLSIGE